MCLPQNSNFILMMLLDILQRQLQHFILRLQLWYDRQLLMFALDLLSKWDDLILEGSYKFRTRVIIYELLELLK